MTNEDRNPQEVLKTAMTEEGLQKLTVAGKKGYSYLRHCVGVVKKHDEQGFAEYCNIKDNKTPEGDENKTAASRRAAYEYVVVRAMTVATESLKTHARQYIEVVSSEDHAKVTAMTNNQGEKPGDLLALKIAGELASGGYNRVFYQDQDRYYHPKHDLGGSNYDEDEDDEDVFECEECGSEYCDEDTALECCDDDED